MHLLFLAETIDNQRAGVHVYNKNLIQALLKIDKKNHYTFIHEKENDFFEDLDHHIIPRKKIPGYGTYRKFFLLPKLINKIKPDIVIEMAHIGPFCTNKNIKRAVIIHDLTPILFPKFHIKRSTLIHNLLLKRILKNADFIITTSQNNKKDILNYLKFKTKQHKNKIFLVKPGVDHLQNNKNDEILQKHNLLESPYLLYLGSIEPRKNIEILISAFIKLKSQENIPHKLVLAGEIAWKSESIIKAAKNHPDIILTNFIEDKDKAALFKNATIFIYPSFYEGFGLPPLESMFYDTPVITSSGGSLKELYSKTALLFDPQDENDLVNKILILLKDPNFRKNLIAKAKNFTKDFQWIRSAKDFLRSIEK